MSDDFTIPAFRSVPRTGVIYVTSEAHKLGYRSADPSWCNLGQGQPETGPLPGAPPRVQDVAVSLDDQEYAPVPCLSELLDPLASPYTLLPHHHLPPHSP